MLEEPRRHEPVSITSLLHKLLLSCTVYSFMALWNSVSVQKLSKKLTTKILCFCKHFWNKSVWILLSHSYFSRFSFRASYQEQDRRNGKSRIMVQQNSSWPLRALLHTVLCEWATTVWSTEQFKPHKIYLSTNTRESQGILWYNVRWRCWNSSLFSLQVSSKFWWQWSRPGKMASRTRYFIGDNEIMFHSD